MKKILVTGKSGCGKSSLLGETVFNNADKLFYFSADHIINNLYKPGNKGYEFIKLNFGDKYIEENGVNKKKLAYAIANSQEFKSIIENAMWPMVKASLLDTYKNIEKLNLNYDAFLIELPVYNDLSDKLFQECFEYSIEIKALKVLCFFRIWNKTKNLKNTKLIFNLSHKNNKIKLTNFKLSNNLFFKKNANKLEKLIFSIINNK